MHVLVAGCGWLGRAVAAALAARGDRVSAVRRDPARAAALAAPGVTPLALDLADPGALAALPPDLDAVVACQAAGGEGVPAYRRAYLDANRTLLAAAAARGARLVYTGSTGVFGQRDGSDVREDTPVAPDSPTAEVLAEAEAMVVGGGGLLVRLSGLYGPGRAGVIERVRAGVMALGPGDQGWTNWCHLDDAVTAVLAVLDRGAPGRAYHASDAAPARRAEVVAWVAARLGIPPPRSEAPSRRGADRRILAEATRAALGITLRHPSFREGLAPLLPGATLHSAGH